MVMQNQNGTGNLTASAWLTADNNDDSVFTDGSTTQPTSQILSPGTKQTSEGDVSTERRPGTFTNQQVPKNLTADESSSVIERTSSVSEQKGAAIVANSLADALPAKLPTDLEQLGSDISAALVNATANLTKVLEGSSGSGPARQQLERVLKDGSDVTGDRDSVVEQRKGNLHGNTDMIGVGQYNSSSKRLLESTRMSQLFGVFGAVLVFALWMLRRRRKPQHSHSEPGLVGPGADRGVGGWLRPRSGRHRLATA